MVYLVTNIKTNDDDDDADQTLTNIIDMSPT